MYSENFSVQQIMIPVDDYPSIREDESIGNAVALILAHSSSDNQHLHYKELLVIDSNDQLVGMLDATSILKSFFPSILGDSNTQVYVGKKQSHTDLSVLLEDHFRLECKRQTAVAIRQYMHKPHHSIDASMHILHALEIIVKDQERTLPVTKNGVLLGAVRVTDIFRALGSYCTM